MSVCVSREIDPFLPPLKFLLEYLLLEFNKVKGRSYSTMNSIRCAISAIATIDDKPSGQHPLVRRFMKAVFQVRPSFPRCSSIWDPEIVLNHIRSLGMNDSLSLLHLSKKVIMLMLLVSGQRGQTLHLLDTRNMTISADKIQFTIGDLLKTSRPGNHLSQIVFTAFPPDNHLCVYTAMLCYLKRTDSIRGCFTRFFLTSKPPIRVASRDTLRRWTRAIMKDAGIDLSVFAPHSTRSASTSKASMSLPLSVILETVGWSRESTFASHYNKPLCKQGRFGEAVLS